MSNSVDPDQLRASKIKFVHEALLLSFRHLSESCFVLGALHKRSKFANFCHDLIQIHLL